MQGNVHKSDEGWNRYRTRTENGARKRPAVRPARQFRPAIPRGVKTSGPRSNEN
jgi:hypothetical protein